MGIELMQKLLDIVVVASGHVAAHHGFEISPVVDEHKRGHSLHVAVGSAVGNVLLIHIGGRHAYCPRNSSRSMFSRIAMPLVAGWRIMCTPAGT